jgi:tetratricopeptide (TPR) repeat protein
MSKYRETISREEFELIERYLLGGMDASENEEFEGLLLKDEILRDEVILQRQLMAAVETGTLSDKSKAPIKTAVFKPLRKLASYRKYAAVILFIAGGCLWWYYGTGSEQNLYTTYFRPDLGLPVVMGSDSTKYLFNEGMVSYKEGNYGQAIGIWEELVTEKGATDTLNYYVGAAYLNIENHDNASAYLIPVSENEHSVFRGKAIWYLALMKLKQKEVSGAKQLLKQLPEKKEAIELLGKIGD